MQAAQLNLLQARLQTSGYKGINFMIINSADSDDADGKLFQNLRKFAGQVITYQEQITEPVWEKLDVLENNILVLDRCGRLTFHVLMPWSMLHQPYVKAAILSTYLGNPCGRCRTKKKTFSPQHKHGFKKKIPADTRSFFKNKEYHKTGTLYQQISRKEETQEVATLSPVVEMPDGTVPIRITYQNPHVHMVNGKEKEFKLVELQTGNPKYHGHPNPNLLQNIIYKNHTKSTTKYQLRQSSKMKTYPSFKHERNYRLEPGKVFKIINNTNENSTESPVKYNLPTNKTSNIKLVIQSKINGTIITYEKSPYPKIIMPNKPKMESNNKFGDIKIYVRKKCQSNNCLGGSVKNKESKHFESNNQFNETSEENILGNATTETNMKIKTENFKSSTNRNETVNTKSLIENNRNHTVDKTSAISKNIKLPSRNKDIFNIFNKTSSIVSNDFRQTNFTETKLSQNTETKNKTALIKDQQNENEMVVTISSPENSVQNTTLVDFIKGKNLKPLMNIGYKTEANKEATNLEIITENKEVTEPNIGIFKSNLEIITENKEVTEPNIGIFKSNLTESKKDDYITPTSPEKTTVSSILDTGIEGEQQYEFGSESTSIIDDNSNIFSDGNLYNDISQEDENNNNEFKDVKSNDKLLEKMAAHYRKLLPFVNYTLTT